MSDLRPAALCCRHCPDDPVHDVPKDGHDVPCPTCERESDAYRRGQRDLAAKAEALAEEWRRRALANPPGYDGVALYVAASELLALLADALPQDADSEPASVPLAAEDDSGAATDVPGAAGLSEAQEALRRLITPLTNQGLDDFRMGRASNDELTRRVVDALLAAGYRAPSPPAVELWRHAECCVTGTGCTHDSDGDCADALLRHANLLHREPGQSGSGGS